MVREKEKPESISCSKLATYGYPYTYSILQEGLQAIGWLYDIGTDSWLPPIPAPTLVAEAHEVAGARRRPEATAKEVEMEQIQEANAARQWCEGVVNIEAELDMAQQKRRYHIQQCVLILKQALEIRRDGALMKEISAHIRSEKDNLTDLLDEIQ